MRVILMIVMLALFNTALYTGLGVWEASQVAPTPEAPVKLAVLVNTMPTVEPVVDPVTYPPIYIAEPVVNHHPATDPNTVNILHQVQEYGGSYSERAEYYNFKAAK
jgi:hypothetical protein